MISERERCWVTHKRRHIWNECPLCGQSIKWIWLWDGTYSPCDEEPVLYGFAKEAKFKVVVKRELLEHITLKVAPGEKMRYGRLPHYYTCPVLKRERQEWAKANKGW